MEFEPGRRLADRFEVIGPPLGEGALGVVYPGLDLSTGAAVALKVLRADGALDGGASRRLSAETAVVGRLHHPHVVRVLGLWSLGERRWMLVSERIDGRPLSAVEGPLAPEAVVALGLQVAGALVAAGEIGLLHGDLRPGNVLVGTRGATVFDFGVSSLIPDHLLRPGETAPERLDGAPPGAAADVWGLGLVLFRAAAGRLPFRGDGPWATLAAERREAEVLHAPRGLAALIHELLRPDPADRPDLASVYAALKRLQGDPTRRIRVRHPIAPFRPGRAWMVHGVDPATGARAMIRSGLSGRAARQLSLRLAAEGWSVDRARLALGAIDLLWVVAATLIGGVVVPVLGAVPAAILTLRWRSRRVRPALASVLPAVTTALPPRRIASGTETAVAAGLLLLLTALTAVLMPPALPAPALLFVALVVWSLRRRRSEPELLVRDGRIRASLAETRHAIEHRALPLDDGLALLGEVTALESDWRDGARDSDDVLVALEALHDRVLAAPVARISGPTVLDALRRG